MGSSSFIILIIIIIGLAAFMNQLKGHGPGLDTQFYQYIGWVVENKNKKHSIPLFFHQLTQEFIVSTSPKPTVIGDQRNIIKNGMKILINDDVYNVHIDK